MDDLTENGKTGISESMMKKSGSSDVVRNVTQIENRNQSIEWQSKSTRWFSSE